MKGRGRIIAAGATLAAAFALCTGGVAWQVQQSQADAKAKWPTLAEEPPLDVPPLRPVDDGWRALEGLIADIDRETEQALRDIVETPGPPIDSGGWVAVADQLDEIEAVFAHGAITSPGIEKFDDPYPELGGALSLGRALCLRGWTSFESGMYAEAIDDMLAADLLGRRLAEGGQTVVSVMIGVAVQDIALTELEELLALVPDPEAHAHAAAGLAVEGPVGQVRSVVLAECHMFEQMFRDFGEDPTQLTQTTSMDGEASEPSLLDRLNLLRYDPDATVAQQRRNCRAQDVRLALPPGARGEQAPSVPEGAESGSHNQIGLALLSMGGPDYGRMVDRELDAQLQRDGLRLLTAARRHAFDHDGQLPASSKALVGVYLPGALPDPFSGESLEIVGGVIQSGRLDQEREWVLTLPE